MLRRRGRYWRVGHSLLRLSPVRCLVAVLVALGLTISGAIWRAWTPCNSHMLLKRRVLTASGTYWRERRDGLKGPSHWDRLIHSHNCVETPCADSFTQSSGSLSYHSVL